MALIWLHPSFFAFGRKETIQNNFLLSKVYNREEFDRSWFKNDGHEGNQQEELKFMDLVFNTNHTILSFTVIKSNIPRFSDFKCNKTRTRYPTPTFIWQKLPENASPILRLMHVQLCLYSSPISDRQPSLQATKRERQLLICFKQTSSVTKSQT